MPKPPQPLDAFRPRFAFQCELFGLTSGQRQQAASAVDFALDSLDPADIIRRDVRQDFVTRQNEVEFFVQADFWSDASGQSVFNVTVNWAKTRASDDLIIDRHSYVRVVVADPSAGVTTRYAASPDWTPSVTTVPFLAPE